jgi:GAF domain-containing protein
MNHRKPKQRRTAKAPGRNRVAARGTSLASLKKKNASLTRQLGEVIEQQTATSEVLKVISRSKFDLQSVLDTLIESATRLCGATRGHIFQFDGEFLRLKAAYGAWPGFTEYLGRHPLRLDRGSVAGRAASERRTVHVSDVLRETDYELGEVIKQQGYRTVLAIPMLRDDALLGVIAILKTNMEPFTDRQINLGTTFADQVVIAIENVRLFEVEQQRSRELTESLQQQTATADVLRVISSSPGELEPVFKSLLDNATRLCVADFGLMFQYKEDSFQLMAQLGADQDWVEYMQRELFRAGPETLIGRVLRARGPVQIEDFAKSKGYFDRDPVVVVAVERGGVRTTLGVPMLRENELIGVISLFRQEVRLFTDRQIELLENFAAQAVIAIENARLLKELRESLEQQTAISEVLEVISSSPGELDSVFHAMVEKAARLCETDSAWLILRQGGALRFVARHNAPAAVAEQTERYPIFLPGPASGVGRSITTKQVVQVPDLVNDQAYIYRQPNRVALVEAGYRSQLSVPLIKDSEAIGAFNILRRETGLFTENQIELVSNFAKQASSRRQPAISYALSQVREPISSPCSTPSLQTLFVCVGRTWAPSSGSMAS